MSRGLVISWPRPLARAIENLAQMNAPVAIAVGNLAEIVLIETTIPARTLGTGGRGRISTKLSGRMQVGANAGTCTLRVRMGSQILATEVIDFTLLVIDLYWYVLSLDFSGRRFATLDVIAGELLGQFQQPQGFQTAAGYWGVRQVFSIGLAFNVPQPFSVTAQFDAALINGSWTTEYAHVDRVS